MTETQLEVMEAHDSANYFERTDEDLRPRRKILKLYFTPDFFREFSSKEQLSSEDLTAIARQQQAAW
jgi:hypothetical protein